MKSKNDILDKITETLVSCDELGSIYNVTTDEKDKEILLRAIKIAYVHVTDVMAEEGFTEQDIIENLSRLMSQSPKGRKKAKGASKITSVANVSTDFSRQVLCQVDCLHQENRGIAGLESLFG